MDSDLTVRSLLLEQGLKPRITVYLEDVEPSTRDGDHPGRTVVA